MPDVRRSHITYPPGPSLMNQPTPPYHGPGASLYGPRGPQRASPDYAARKPLSAPPESLADHIDDAIARIPDLSARQRAAVKAAMTVMLRDIGFNRLMAEQSRAHAIPTDQGRPL
jgi:hypothetical protein